jgi:hypothetical protein
MSDLLHILIALSLEKEHSVPTAEGGQCAQASQDMAVKQTEHCSECGEEELNTAHQTLSCKSCK